MSLGKGLYALTLLKETVRDKISSSCVAFDHAVYYAGWNSSVLGNKTDLDNIIAIFRSAIFRYGYEVVQFDSDDRVECVSCWN